ncbi:MAG: LPS export ABC transporter periplasmic protein LptC [Cyanobacteria bacterium J06632_22]
MTRWYRWTAIAAVVVMIAVGARTCQQLRASRSVLDDAPESVAEAGLTLRNITLEQPDEKGGLLWRVKAKSVTYSPDQQIADIRDIEGEFFQGDTVIYEVTADRGEIIENGRAIFLEGNIEAFAVEDDLTLTGDHLAWRPDDDQLEVTGGIDGDHPQLTATAETALLYNQEKRLELTEGVTAATLAEPWLVFESEAVTWNLADNVLATETPLQVNQFPAEDDETVIGQLNGQRGTVRLDEQEIELLGEVELTRTEPPLELNSDALLWQTEQQLVTTDQPLEILETQRQIVVTANQGRLDLENQIVTLTEAVQLTSAQNQAQLNAYQVTWKLESEDIEASGNIRYRQTNPETQLSGERAIGNLQQQTVIVTGNDVITTIVPE